MFTLVSEHGNVQKIVESEHKRDELLSKGYKLIDPDPAEEETTLPPADEDPDPAEEDTTQPPADEDPDPAKEETTQPPADEDPDPAEETKKTNAPKGKGKNAKTEE